MEETTASSFRGGPASNRCCRGLLGGRDEDAHYAAPVFGEYLSTGQIEVEGMMGVLSSEGGLLVRNSSVRGSGLFKNCGF